ARPTALDVDAHTAAAAVVGDQRARDDRGDQPDECQRGQTPHRRSGLRCGSGGRSPDAHAHPARWSCRAPLYRATEVISVMVTTAIREARTARPVAVPTPDAPPVAR